MSEEIKVHIVKEKDRANYSMRYIDPMTGKGVKKSTGKAKRKDALMKAGEWEKELREGRYVSRSKVTWEGSPAKRSGGAGRKCGYSPLKLTDGVLEAPTGRRPARAQKDPRRAIATKFGVILR